jgi:hypothetical protein
MEGIGDTSLPEAWDLGDAGDLPGLDNLLDDAINAGQLDVLGAGLQLDQLPVPLPPLTAQGSGSTGGAGTALLESSSSDPSALDEQQRRERIRAQNREKQQRFRQRQRVGPAWSPHKPLLGLAPPDTRCMASAPHCFRCGVAVLQAKKKEMEEQYGVVSVDLERERAANDTLRLTTSVMEGMKAQKEAAVEALQAASLAERGGGAANGGPNAALSAGPQAAGAGALALRLSAMPFQQRVELCCRLFLQSPARELVEQHGILEEGQQLVDGFALDME